MTRKEYSEVDFGDELPEYKPDITMPMIRRFAETSGMKAWRFTDHDRAKAEGLPGAIVPGIMSQGILVAMIHSWAPNAEIEKVDTIFRASLLVDSEATCRGVVTDMDDETHRIEIDLTIVNERGETPVIGTANIRL